MERTNIGLLLAKIEGSYGTDSSPTGGSNLIAVTRQGVKFSPNFTHLTRQILDGTLGKSRGRNTLPEVSLDFRVELRGNRTDGTLDSDITSGAAAQAIPIDCLLQACDLVPDYNSEGIHGPRQGWVEYHPIEPVDQGKSVTFYWFTGTKLHKIWGGKGTFKATFEAGQMAYLDLSFKGLYGDVCDAAMPKAGNYLQAVAVGTAGTGYVVGDILTVAGGTASTTATIRVTAVDDAGGLVGVKVLQVGLYSVSPTTNGNNVTGGTGTSGTVNLTMAAQTAPVFLDTVPPVFVNSGSTIDAYSPVFQKLDFDLGTTVTRRDDANAMAGVRGFLITARDSKATIDPESVGEASNPVWNDLYEATARTITATIGTKSGNRVQLVVKGISTAVGYGDRSGIRTNQIDYSAERPNQSDAVGSEITLKFY